MSVKTYREKQRSLGRTEIRSIFCDTEEHKDMKLHIKHLLRLKGEGKSDEQIHNRLSRGRWNL